MRDGSREFPETARYYGFLAAHNIAVTQETGYAYAVAGSGDALHCEGGLHVIDFRDPLAPTFAGCYVDPSTLDIHDTQCLLYHGPDRRYQGHELCFNAAGNAVSVADVTDKRRPVTIGIARYPDIGYALQGSLSKDQRFFSGSSA